jgi:hypothetical protein
MCGEGLFGIYAPAKLFDGVLDLEAIGKLRSH